MSRNFIDRLLLPAIVGLTTFVFALILLQRLLTQQDDEIQTATIAQASFVKSKVESELKARILPLELLGERWQVQQGDVDRQFDADQVVSLYPGYRAIQWVDPTFNVVWAVPEARDKADLGADVGADAPRRVALQAAKASGRVSVTHPVDLRQGGRGVLVCVPVFSGAKLSGFVIGAFRYQDLIASILQDVAADYWVALYDGDEAIYGRDGASRPRKGPLVQEEEIQFQQLTWRARIWPKSETLGSILPQITFGGGILLAGLLGFAVYLAETAQLQAQQVASANNELRKMIAAREQAEKAMREAQKMEAVGRLAGGVAHDFNNLLTVISGHSTLLLNRFSHDSLLRQKLNEIVKTSQRASSLTRQLLAFSRKQVLQLRVLDLNGLVAQVADLLPPVLGEDIALTLDLDPHLGNVRADAAQIEQVIMNLVFNARDAMPRGGALTIKTVNCLLDETWTGRHPGIRSGWHVMLAVRDTGYGMDEETQSHIFEPFFTTKDKSKGTGLGLATAHGTVNQIGGCVTVSSKLGEGTTIEIFLPRVEEPIETSEAADVPLGSLEGNEMILVVEDDDAVRRMTLEFLKIRGYTVVEARSAADAIQFVEHHTGPIDLVLTDVLMPGIKGRELGERLAKLRPDIRVLYMSAYTEDAVIGYEMLGPEMAFIEKPFSPDELARKVREVLATKGENRAKYQHHA